MDNKVIFCKGEAESSDWDDTALIKAYDDAINSFKEKLNNNGVPQNSQQKKKKEKKSKKSQGNDVAEVDQHSWTVGDRCFATYSEDGIVYEAAILSIDHVEQTCQVKYSYYGNEEMQKLEDLQKYEDCNESVNHGILSNGVSDADNASVASGRSRKSSLSSVNRKQHKSSSSYKSHHFPQVPPPPLPDLSSITSESDALQGMLISWYMSGYYTGYYEGLQASKKKK